MASIQVTCYDLNLTPEELDQIVLTLEYALENINHLNNSFMRPLDLNEDMVKYLLDLFPKLRR